MADTAQNAQMRLTLNSGPCPALTDADYLAATGRPWIAPALQSQLFAAPGAADLLPHTFLVVDAAQRAKIIGDFDLDDVDVPVLCLFKGDAAEDMREVAPYLIDLTLPPAAWEDDAQVPRFHRDFFAHHMLAETGILLRSALGFHQIHAHFRKFTKVRMPDASVAFFRFWEPRMLIHFLQACTSEELLRFFPSAADHIFAAHHSALLRTSTLTRAALSPQA